MNKLKPCPFCGCEDITAEIATELREFRIYCCSDEGCPAEMCLAFEDAGLGTGFVIDFDEAQRIMEQLEEAWNRRANNADDEED